MEYLSQECYDSLVAELKQLIEVDLPRVKGEIQEAREKGDLSENFEYHAAKRSQGILLSRIRFKQRVLEHARVMDTSQLGSDTVGLFRKVEITNLTTNTKMAYTIVNPHEANLKESKISIKSPIAEALVGKSVGDTVEVKVPAGILTLRIDNITV
ncbi:MAG: transcription elongation factor GreA [Bacteroidaceae bacterium]|nr:transcription elongation factor GreA [Bacteroidaceae bacterium]